MMLLKCCTLYASKFGKLSSGQKTEKGQISFQFQRKAMPKNVPTTTQLYSSNMLSKVMLKIVQDRFQLYMNQELADVQAGFSLVNEADVSLEFFSLVLPPFLNPA